MTRRDPRVAVEQMLAHAREVAAMVHGRTRPDLDADRMFALAAVRLLEIVGEAASRVPAAVRASLPGVPWAEIVALRNRLIHGYDGVDHDIVWRVLADDVPALVSALERGAGGGRSG